MVNFYRVNYLNKCLTIYCDIGSFSLNSYIDKCFKLNKLCEYMNDKDDFRGKITVINTGYDGPEDIISIVKEYNLLVRKYNPIAFEQNVGEAVSRINVKAKNRLYNKNIFTPEKEYKKITHLPIKPFSLTEDDSKTKKIEKQLKSLNEKEDKISESYFNTEEKENIDDLFILTDDEELVFVNSEDFEEYEENAKSIMQDIIISRRYIDHNPIDLTYIKEDGFIDKMAMRIFYKEYFSNLQK